MDELNQGIFLNSVIFNMIGRIYRYLGNMKTNSKYQLNKNISTILTTLDIKLATIFMVIIICRE